MDYNVPPSGTNEFFIMTNAVITHDQRRGQCPEDYTELPSTLCCKGGTRIFSTKENSDENRRIESNKHNNSFKNDNNTICNRFEENQNKLYPKDEKRVGTAYPCIKEDIKSHKSHGRETGRCVKGDRKKDDKFYACEIRAWCPVELDVLPLPDRPLIMGTENFTVFIKNMISFPLFDMHKYQRDNMPNGMCEYIPEDESTRLCSIFRIGDIVRLAGGNVAY